jgi:hypothetical protein
MITTINKIMNDPKWVTPCPICGKPTISMSGHMVGAHGASKPSEKK